MSKTHAPQSPVIARRHFLYFTLGLGIGVVFLVSILMIQFETTYRDRVYPGVSIAHVPFTDHTLEETTFYWLERNIPFHMLLFTFEFEDRIATISGVQLDLGFDATLSATQALSIGRSGHIATDFYHKYRALKDGVDLKPLFKWNSEVFDYALDTLAQVIDVEPENALFEFQNGRVAAFKPAKPGRAVNKETIKRRFIDQLELLTQEASPPTSITFQLPVDPKEPLIKTDHANDLGITELIGRGESYFRGSISGRIHNVSLAASRVNGVLIPPGQTFSFNQTVGDISAATGYKQAYVIKSGRTVLDDGGGVCQVSTTLFRAALNSGLSIEERHAHSYRVSYYEQGGWKPGFDATVYAPSYDLKIKNDTPAHILIQATTDTKNLKLTFELYGKSDGRTVEISPVRLWDAKPPPPDLYQDDPTLPSSSVKQVDWAAPGIKSAFDYVVKLADEDIFKKTFYSNFIPWQAVYLRGTGPTQ